MVVVLDTNVLVSAFQFGGNPELLIDMAHAGKLDVAVSPSILDEFTRILRDKFEWSDEALAGAMATLSRCARLVQPAVTPRVVEDDPNDDHVVACAFTAGANAIITGDKDLLRMDEYQGIKMMRVSEFLGRRRDTDTASND